MRRVVDKLLHAPTVRVKELAGSPGGDAYEDALRVLFDLDPAVVAAVTQADTERARLHQPDGASGTAGPGGHVSRPPLRLGTRKSPMAMTQSGQVARLITERTGVSVELVGVTTFGDVTRAELAQIGGTGVFASALRETLLAGQVDLAVHSLKDLPVPPRPGCCWPRCRSARTRGTRWPPGTAPSSRTCLPGPRSAPGRRAGPPSCGCCAPTSGRCRSAATRAPGWARSNRASWTRCCWPAPGWPGSAGWTP